MPTTCTVVSRLADAAKNIAEPPITFSALPNGVSTESRATDPTTSTVMWRRVRGEMVRSSAERWSHALGSGDAEHRETVAQNDTTRVREEKPRMHDRGRLIEHMMLVIPGVHQLRRVVQIACHAMRLQRLGGAGEHWRKVQQRLDQLSLLGLDERIKVDVARNERRRINVADAKNPAQARVRHLDVIDRILLRLRAREIDVEHQLRLGLSHREEVAHRIAADVGEQLLERDDGPRALGELHFLSVAHELYEIVQDVVGIAFRDPDR